MIRDSLTSEVLHEINKLHFITSVKIIEAINTLAKYRFNDLGTTENPFCNVESNLEFRAYEAATQNLLRPNLNQPVQTHIAIQ